METLSKSPAATTQENADVARSGALILNADDWGRDQETTNRIFDCLKRQTISSVSAMVFMEDSQRSAAMAREAKVDAGLHLNFTTRFSAPGVPPKLGQAQSKIGDYLLRRRFNSAVFHPGLIRDFQYVVAAQLEEFQRLYGTAPKRVDGHHHMHLCANVLFRGLLPGGTVARRNFSFQPGEKSWINRQYRQVVDRALARRHCLTDYFFSLPPLEPQSRLERIRELAEDFVVEVETHPVKSDEYRFLMEDGVVRWKKDLPIASHFAVSVSKTVC